MLTTPHLRLDEGDHVVQFYERDDDLIGVVAGYLTAALTEGDSVVVIATPEHRAALQSALALGGVDAADRRHGGRLAVLDARETLDRFMLGDRPSAERFDAVVGELVRSCASTGGPVRAYGEMVALLCAEGNRAGAEALERLWNALGSSVPFSLFCAYPTHTVAEATDVICGLHSHVLPPADDVSRSRAFDGSPQELRRARRFVSETLVSWAMGSAVEDAAVVVSELAANAVNHAKSAFTVSVTRMQSGVRVGVADRSTVLPVVREPAALASGGRGLVLVDRLATRWGHSLTDVGKVVWADVPMSPVGVTP